MRYEGIEIHSDKVVADARVLFWTSPPRNERAWLEEVEHFLVEDRRAAPHRLVNEEGTPLYLVHHVGTHD